MAVLARRLLWTLFCSAYWAASSPALGCVASSDLLGEAVRSFDRAFYPELSHEERGNLFYSPVGLHVLLAEAYFGSPRESTTAKELETLLGFSAADPENYLCEISRGVDGLGASSKDVGLANRVFVAGDLATKSLFKSTLATHFKSELQQIDFHGRGAASVINGFASDQTRGLITNIVKEEDLGPNTRLVFVSAIFFKGTWNIAFPEAATTREVFKVDNDRHTHYDAMHLKANLQHFNVAEIEAEVLRIPYASEQFEMVVVLPHAGSNITRVESKVAKSNVVFDVFESSDAFSDVTLSLPKFEVNFDVSNAVEVLEALGVRSMFRDGFADFSNISDEPLSVSKLVHKAVVRVDEDGTRATAASSEILTFKSALPQPPPKIMFTVDRPFLFYIYDNVAKMPIFKGRIVDPNGQSKLKF